MRVGFLAKRVLNEQEAYSIHTIGSILAKMGHTLVTTDSPGGNQAVLKGVRDENGRVDLVTANVKEHSDITVIYADDALARRLELAGISASPDLIIMRDQDDLDTFTDEAVVAAYRKNLDI